MNVRTVRIGVLMILAGLGLAPVAQGTLIHFTVGINGAQADAGNGTGSPGTGAGIVVLDTDADTIDWHIEFAGLEGEVTGAHFHGPALPTQNAGFKIGISDVSGFASPLVASDIPIDEGLQADLINDLLYVNIHTTLVGGGEIRGQVIRVIPEPMTLTLLALGSVPLLLRRRRG
jgi:hypothetical protein